MDRGQQIIRTSVVGIVTNVSLAVMIGSVHVSVPDTLTAQDIHGFSRKIAIDMFQNHGFYYSEKENLVTADVVPDLSVKDDLALCQTLTQELNALLPGKTVLIAVDHNYSE